VDRPFEHALKLAERALDHIDDSGGQMGDAIARIEELHLDACSKARPDPEALAERLFAWELAEEAWAKVPKLAPGERDLSIGYRFLQIAELCREHGEDDAALEWAEPGMAAFAEDADPRLAGETDSVT
jgi:hypothetical protein